jgi:uncharacterized protein YcbK (DUF882 family)
LDTCLIIFIGKEMMTLITKHFTLEELTYSDIGIRNNIENIPNSEQIENLKQLTYNVLQPLRTHFDKPVVITSGFRNLRINTLVGGKTNSQHLKGEAVDFIIQSVPFSIIIDYIKNNLDFDQCINEYNQWIHCSYSQNRNRKQVFRIG